MKKSILFIMLLAFALGVVSNLGAQITVTGIIVGSDSPTVGIDGGAVHLYGIMDYTAITNSAGQFVVENVLSGHSYNYTLSKAGYETATGTIIVGTADYDMGSITLNEIVLPPSNITATVNDAGTSVNLIWDSPGTPGSFHFFDFEFDDGGWSPSSNWADPLGDWEYTDSYDVTNFVPSYTGANVTPPNIAHSGTGMWGTVINANHSNSGGFSYLSKTFDFSAFSDIQMRFWSWENLWGDWDYAQVKVNGTLVWGPSWDYAGTIWHERVIDLSAYDGMIDVEIRFEMFATTTINYAGWYIDDIYIGPADQVVRSSVPSIVPGEFRGLSEMQAAQLAEERLSLRPVREMANSMRQPAYNSPRLLLGYEVWRMERGQENTPDLWVSLTPSMITDTTFTDLAWASLPDGFYKWAVKTVYSDNVVSNPGFSNAIRLQPNDMGALSISGNTTPTVGIPSNYTLRIKNTGTSAQTDGAYTVKLMSGYTELASVPGSAIAAGHTLDVVVSWNPGEQGSTMIYGKVVLLLDSDPTNDETDAVTLLVMPAGQFAYTVGEGNELANVPVNMEYKSSLFQMIIYPAELSNFYGFVNGIRLYNNFVTNLPSIPTRIWFETTTLENLSVDNIFGGWVPITDASTLVFDGSAHYLAGENTVFIPFTEPFVYMSGGNLLITVQRPMEDSYHSSSDRFRSQTIGNNRARLTQSNSIEYDATNPPSEGVTSGQFPMFTLLGAPGGVGNLRGTVTTGTNNTPLEGVSVQIEGANPGAGYEATSNADGEYEIPYVLVGTYDVLFSKYGYVSLNQVLEMGDNEEVIINLNMSLKPTFSVSGTIVASDTGGGLAGAVISLSGYADYTQSTSGNGEFIFADVYANESYEYTIRCFGYTSATGIIAMGATAYQMGTLTLNEIAYAPSNVVAGVNDTFAAVELQWSAPDQNAFEILESFEGATFPPQDWSQIITNIGAPNSMGVYPTFKRLGSIDITGMPNAIPTDGSFQTGLWWTTLHQDEWLITPAFDCPPDAYLSFDSYVFLGSENGDHYYVKASVNNGNTWQVLWDASAQAGGESVYEVPFTIDLTPYDGQQIMLAFHADDPATDDGLWHPWFIDNIYIGNTSTIATFEAPVQMHHPPVITSNMQASDLFTRGGRSVKSHGMKTAGGSKNPDSRSLVGYNVYRLTSGQEANEASWTQINDELLSNLAFEDDNWQTLPDNTYRWGIKAIYTADVSSPAAFSNPLAKNSLTGSIVGFVRRSNGQGIAGATVAAGTHETTSNPAGAYSLILPVGVYSVSASAASYKTITIDNILVSPNQNTTLNILLETAAGEDELSPVTATALKGNSPNPFNPNTTIYYDIMEPCNVRLDVYNVKGQKVRSLLNESKNSGRHSIVFEANDMNGKPLSSGIYFYRFSAGKYHATRKMLLME